MTSLVINIDGKNYQISSENNINLSKLKEDNIENIFIDNLENRYDTSKDGVINSGNEINIFMNDLAEITKEDNSFDEEKLEKYLSGLTAENKNSLKDKFLKFLKAILPQEKENVNKTNKWIVQNNQSLEKISKMILKQTNPNYTYNDILAMNKKLKELNPKHLDGSKNGFLVGHEIQLPVEINISNEKVSANPIYDYVLWSQTERINNIIKDHNLIDKNINTEFFNDMKGITKEFTKRYGRLHSSSRDTLLLEPYFSSSENIDNNIKYIRGHNQDSCKKIALDKTDTLVKKYKTANCAEYSDLIDRLIFNKFKDKYSFSKITFDDVRYNPSKGHVATLVKSKTGNEEYVIDMWINPNKGGIYKKSEWIEMMQKVFQLDNAEIDELGATQTRLIEEEKFCDSVKKFKGILPDEYLVSSERLAKGLYNDILDGKAFTKDIMDLWERHGKYYINRMEKFKDFYASRHILAKEIPAKSLKDPVDFNNEVYKGLINGKQYSTTVINIFKKYFKSDYENYIQITELTKISKLLKKYFPEEKNLQSKPGIVLYLVSLGLQNKKTYPAEIMTFFKKYASKEDLKSLESAN